MYKVFKAFQQFKNIEEINKNLLIKFKINQWHFNIHSFYSQWKFVFDVIPIEFGMPLFFGIV